jgi:hypothetical protein
MKKKMTVEEMASMGGNALKKKMPEDYFKELGRSGAEKRWGKKNPKKS